MLPKLLTAILVSIPLFLVGQQKFQHTSSATSINGNSSFIKQEGLDNNPRAIIIVEPDGKTKQVSPHPVGVWFDGKHWAIFNQDMAPMLAGLNFTVSWKNPDGASFIIRSSKLNQGKDGIFIDHPLLNNNPIAGFQISQVWNPEGKGGIYNNSDIIVSYDKAYSKWVVKNTNGRPIPENAAFNVITNETKDVSKSIDLKKEDKLNPGAIKTNDQFTLNTSDLLAAIADKNLGFERGILNWRAEGNAFHQTVQGNSLLSERVQNRMAYDRGGVGGDYWKGMQYPIGVKDNNWIGSFENGNGDGATGTLTSAPITAIGRYLHFLMGGGKDINSIYVELQVKLEDYQAAWGADKQGFFGNTHDGFTKVNRLTPLINSEELFRYFFDLDAELNHKFKNQTVRISIVDNSTRNWGHINVDDFGFSDHLKNFIHLRKDGFGLYADADKPVWGYADTHAHPTHQEGFGRKTIIGKTDAPLEVTYSQGECNGLHGFGVANNGFIAQADPHFMKGWPDFAGFPKFNSKTHQQQHTEFLKRAWQGGLRLFCALAVNNMYLPSRTLGLATDGTPLDDETTMYRELDSVKNIAARHSDWMEIAYTPADARRIIHEGKLCIVLGVEVDNFANFKGEDYGWIDRQEDRRLVLLNNANASTLIPQKLDEYYRYGIRQITPIHYVSGVFGGAAYFMYPTTLSHLAFRDKIFLKEGKDRGVHFNLFEDYSAGPSVVGSFLSFETWKIRVQGGDNTVSHINSEGLTPIGNKLLTEMMKRGMLIDCEHMSFESKDNLFNLPQRVSTGYPIMSSHTDPIGVTLKADHPSAKWEGNDDAKMRVFGTANIRNITHEGQMLDEHLNQIRNSGGTVGVIMLPYKKKAYSGSWGRIPNDCHGSSKTWAQMYLHCIDKMNGKGVALATDRGMVEWIAPRFGVYSSWRLKDEPRAAENDWARKIQRIDQKEMPGVKYDRKMQTFHEDLFGYGEVPGIEEDAWKALQIWEAGINPFVDESRIPNAADLCCLGRIKSFARGLFATNLSQLRTCCGDSPYEEGAMYLLQTGQTPAALETSSIGYWRDHRADVERFYSILKPIYDVWKNKEGHNEPIRRYRTGNRDWDFNIDGLAHYGLMPDFLQDLKNIGVNGRLMTPLFNSAEDYIRMWEKAEAAKRNIRD